MLVISLGAGVQSSALLLMACHGVTEKPDMAIFADTGWEPQSVYAHLDWLRAYAADYGIPIETVSNGNLGEDLMAAGEGKRFASIPFFLRVVKGNQWSNGMARRQCTNEYKLRPLQRRVRALGATAKNPVRVQLGISTDEIRRAKPSQVKYCLNEFPLIELGMSRADCLTWIADKGMPTPPRSACIGCPYRDRHGWQQIKADPQAWADAIEKDEAIRKMPRFRGEAFLHSSRKPLADVDLSDFEDGPDLFDNECEGLCGV